MKENISTGFAVSVSVILVVFLGGAFFFIGKRDDRADTLVSQVMPQSNTITQEIKQPNTVTQSSQVDTSDWKTYKNDTYGFEFKYPEEWFEQKPLDGLMAFNAYFTSKDIANNYNKLGKYDVQFSIMKSKDETQVNNDELLRVLDTIKGAVISGKKSVTVDGNEGTMQFQDASVSDPGCRVVAYFKKNSVSYQIQMGVSGLNNCETVQRHESVYNAILGTFRVK